MVLAVTAFYFFVNPNEYHFLPCIFYKITGKYCFGCGGQRAFHALLHGNFTEAFRDNLLIFSVLPIVGIKLFNEVLEKKYLEKYFQNKFSMVFFLAILLLFMVIRNLPFEPFTTLIPKK